MGETERQKDLKTVNKERQKGALRGKRGGGRSSRSFDQLF